MSTNHPFFEHLWQHHVLCLGDFTLKSGRQSPYFFNFGKLASANGMKQLGRFYAQKMVQKNLDVNVIFGPAYKGIYLALSTAMAYAEHTKRDVEFATNRKEAKTHGEGGQLMGADLVGKKIIIVDDVLTQGSALKEVMPILAKIKGIQIIGMLIAIDRQEVLEGTNQTAKQMVESRYNLPLYRIATLADLIKWMGKRADTQKHLQAIEQYADQYVQLGD